MLFFVLGKHRFYDQLSRLLEADYDNGTTVYQYGYDLAGNLVNNNGTTRTYNAANQMVNDGTNTLTYDANGNLTNDGVNAYTWDRANRMLTAPGSTS
jgi:YD repeat-containing protein